jgi:alpha-1,3-rhamnosyl/mannosyltransferase
LRQRHADLYHSAYVAMPYAPLTPTVLTVYDLIPLLYPEQSSGRARRLAGLLNRLALRAARVVLAISEATRRDYIHHLGVHPAKIVTVPLAADCGDQEAGSRRQGANGESDARRDTPYILYLGSNKPHKNLVRLVEAWGIASRRLPMADCRLVIAGAWDDRYPEARRRAAELGLADRVLFLGPVAEADLPDLYRGAALFVFPSLYEGFGLPVLEAMACGAPVICANTSSLPEVAGDAAYLVNPFDVDELAAAIERILDDETLRRQMRASGLAQAARFSWAQTARQTLAVYRAVASGALARPIDLPRP